MESKWEKCVVSLKSLEADSEIDFSHGVPMSKMESTVQVRVRECSKVFLFARSRIGFKGMLSFPFILSLFFKLYESVSPG